MSDKNKQNFNGGYIKASQEAYDLLVEAGIGIKCNRRDIDQYYVVEDGCFFTASLSYIKHSFQKESKQFYINNGALSWEEPIQINSMEDLNELPIVGEEDVGRHNDRNTGNDSSSNDSVATCTNKTISITDENGKVYEFEKPEFECELLVFRYRQICGIGFEHYSDETSIYPIVWDKKGKSTTHNNMDLTPIKPKWYEDKALIGKRAYLIHATSNEPFIETVGKINAGTIVMIKAGHLRLATKAERDSLTVEED